MRIAEKKDLDALCGLFENAHHASPDYARMALERFAGVETCWWRMGQTARKPLCALCR